MSIQHTAELALQAIEELYKAIDLSGQQQSPMSINDSENLIQALCNLSQLIEHINQTGMCGHTPRITTNFDSNPFDRKKTKNFINPHWNNYDENIMMDSAVIGPPPQPGQPYGECVLYHPIRIITTCADGPTVLHESDFVKKEGQYRKGYDHSKRFTHYNHTKKNRRRMSKTHGRRSSKSISRASRTSRSGSRGSRMSRRSSRGRASQSRARSSRSSRTSRSSRSGRRSRSSQRGSRRSRSSQRRSRSHRRSSHKRRSTDQKNRQYYARQIPSRPVSTTTTTNPTAPSNQMASTSIGTQPSIQPPYIRSLSSPAPISTANNGPLLPPPTFTPSIHLPPPPVISTLHHPSSQIPMQQYHQSPLSSINRPVINPLSDPSSSYQQVPVSTTSTGNTALSQQQQSSSLSSTNPLLTIPIQNGISPSELSPIQTANSTFTSSSNNCPECRAITRLLQWAPLKCYDAAGIRRGVFLAGPKSEQLLKALYSSIKDSSLSLDDIEDCLCDNE